MAYQIMSPTAPVLLSTLQVLKSTGPMTTADLAELMGLGLKATKTRLHVMKTHGMVENREVSGKRYGVWYALCEDAVPEAIVQASSVWEYARRCAA